MDLGGDIGGKKAAAGVQARGGVVLDETKGNKYMQVKDSSVFRGCTSLINPSSTVGV